MWYLIAISQPFENSKSFDYFFSVHSLPENGFSTGTSTVLSSTPKRSQGIQRSSSAEDISKVCINGVFSLAVQVGGRGIVEILLFQICFTFGRKILPPKNCIVKTYHLLRQLETKIGMNTYCPFRACSNFTSSYSEYLKNLRNDSKQFFGGWRYTPKKWKIHRIMRYAHDVMCTVHFLGYTSIHWKIVSVITCLI